MNIPDSAEIHWCNLGLLTQIWTWCKRIELTIAGMSSKTGASQFPALDSRSLLYWKKTTSRIQVVRGEIDKNSSDSQTRSCVSRSRDQTLRIRSETRRMNGRKGSPSSITFENWEEFASLILKWKSTKKPSELRGRSWRFSLEAAIFCKKRVKVASGSHNCVRGGVLWVHKAASRTNYAKVSRILNCLQRVELNGSLQFGTQFFASSHENSGCDSCRGQGMDKARNNFQHGSSRAKREVIQEALKDMRKVHCAALIDICHLKNAELEPKFEKYKGSSWT